jgi:sarcosine oxidase
MTWPDADVAVVGLGTMGSHALWRLAERGIRAVGIEQFEPGHDRGSGHGESRIIRTAYHEGADYVPLVRESYRLWRALEQQTGATVLTMTGALMIGDADGPLVTGTLSAAAQHGLPHEILDADQLFRNYPQHRLHPGGEVVAVREPDAGVLLPEHAIKAAVAAARAGGAHTVTGERVLAIEPVAAGRVRVRLSSGDLVVRHVISAAGAWTGTLLRGVGSALRVRRKVLGWFPTPAAADYQPDRFPVFIREDPQAQWFGFPTMDGSSLKFGIHEPGPRPHPALDKAEGPADPDTVDRRISQDDVAPLTELVTAYLPGLRTAPTRSSVCLYTLSPDQHFIIGPAPGAPDITVLAGFSGHGFKFAPVVGEAAAQFATDGGTGLPMEMFAPGRLPDRQQDSQASSAG